jgi:hypothetical protein
MENIGNLPSKVKLKMNNKILIILLEFIILIKIEIS